MKASVILAHPRAGSLNHALAACAVETLRGIGYDVRFHDLYAEGFDPTLPAEELEAMVFADALAAQHAAEIREAERVVVVHPSWFFHVPAILKGWVDRVLREGIAFNIGQQGIEGLLRVRTALVVTTANAPRGYEVEGLGDPLTTFWRDCVFAPAGVQGVERIALSPVRGSSAAVREAWLQGVMERIRSAEGPAGS